MVWCAKMKKASDQTGGGHKGEVTWIRKTRSVHILITR